MDICCCWPSIHSTKKQGDVFFVCLNCNPNTWVRINSPFMQMSVGVGFSVISDRVCYIIKDSRGHWGSEKWNNLSRIPSYCNVTPFFFSLKTVFSAVPYWFGIVVLHFWHISQYAEPFHSTCTTDQFTAPTTGLFIFIVINTILSFPLSRWEC